MEQHYPTIGPSLSSASSASASYNTIQHDSLSQLVVTLVRSTKLLYAGPVSTEMGDRIGVQLPVREIYQSNQLPRSTQPGHSSVGRRNEYRPNGGNALRLGVKADMVLFAGNIVRSISERVRSVCVDALYKSTYTLLYFVVQCLAYYATGRTCMPYVTSGQHCGY